MKTYIIHVPESNFSKDHSIQCLKSCKNYGVDAEIFDGYDPIRGNKFINERKIPFIPVHKNIAHWSFNKAKRGGVQGCFASHFALWEKCIELKEPIIILEHDARIFAPVPNLNFKDLLQLNIKGYKNKPEGRLYEKISYNVNLITTDECYYWKNEVPLTHGTGAYIIKPHAANILVKKNCFGPADHIINGLWLKIERLFPPCVYLVNDGVSLTLNYDKYFQLNQSG